MVGYCNIGLYEPGNDKPENNKFADTAIEELQKYLKQRPKDETAREALFNLFLNAERTSQAIDYFKEYLKENPADLNAVRSVATLYAKSGDFNESLNWYKKITLLDSKNPEAFYTFTLATRSTAILSVSDADGGSSTFWLTLRGTTCGTGAEAACASI